MNDLSGIYQIFGVERYAAQLEKSGDKTKLEQLNRIIAKFILLKATDDIPEKDLDVFEAADFKNENDLLMLLEKYIPDFSNKLNTYGKQFQTEYSTRITA